MKVVYVAVMSLSHHAYFQIWIDNDPATQRQMRDSLVPKYHCNVNFTLKRAYLCLPKNSGGRLEGSGAATGSTLMMGDDL